MNTTTRQDFNGTRIEITLPSATPAAACDNEFSKLPLTGLCIRQSDWFNAENPDLEFLTAVSNVVIRENLREIWPEEGTFNFEPIIKWRTWQKKLKEQHGVNVYFKLRIVCGAFAPTWMKNQCGSFLLSAEGFEDLPGVVTSGGLCVKFWTEEYLTLWDRLMKALANEFDNDDFLREVVCSGTGAASGEAMEWGNSNDGAGLTRLGQYMNAGATDENVQAAVRSTIDSMQAWKRTNIGMAITKYHSFTLPSESGIEISKELGEYLAWSFKRRSILGNNGLRLSSSPNGAAWTAPQGDQWLLEMFYNGMRFKHGSRLYNQTASEEQMGGYDNIVAVLNRGLDFHDVLIEMPGDEGTIKEILTKQEWYQYTLALKVNLLPF